MQFVNPADFSRIAQDLQVRRVQVENVVQLLDEGNTVPFITRYRKERTGGLNEEAIRQVQCRIAGLRQLGERRETILKSIEAQGKLTNELRTAIQAADSMRRLEDLYLPYKPKKRTLASAARERGLEPLAKAVWERDPIAVNLDELLPTMVDPDKGLATAEEVRQGIQHILAEEIAESADVRAAVRSVLWGTSKISSTRNEALPEGKGVEYAAYFQFAEEARNVPPHRILAMNRGEKEGALKVRLEWNVDQARRAALGKLPLADHPHAIFLHTVAEDALNRLLLPSLEREIRRELTDEAEEHAIKVFARNLRKLLLQLPLQGRRVLAIDPGFRTGCKLAALDETGLVLEDGIIYPHQPHKKRDEAKRRLEELVRRHQLGVIAIGNGSACRETEELIAELISEITNPRPEPTELSENPPAPETSPKPVAPSAGEAATVSSELQTPSAEVPSAPEPVPPVPIIDLSSLPPAPTDLAYTVVNEAGASVYSTSLIGREEFPNLDATMRGTISIGRRLQDPLSELVKIDPQNIGVGLYQHDITPRRLKTALDAVVESSVNHVGVDLNTASVPLLRYVSGLNQLVARDIVEFRKQNGPFRTREDLLQVPNLGPARYVQAAGFLKIVGGDQPLDRTWIHPESYPVAQQVLADLGYSPHVVEDRQRTEELREKLKSVAADELSGRLQVGLPTVRDILEALARPGRDPREELPPPVFRKNVLNFHDLQPGMELKGTVLNVVDFGAFVDIGLKDSGLVHISQLANRYVRNPHDVVAVGDVVNVWVMSVDQGRKRVSLTMIPPGSERRMPAKREPAKRPARSPRRAKKKAAQQARALAAPQPALSNAAAAPEVTTPEVAPPVPTPTPAAAHSAAPPPPRKPAAGAPPAPHRKTKRSGYKPKLSQAALEGKVSLRSFGELKVFFESKGQEPPAFPS